MSDEEKTPKKKKGKMGRILMLVLIASVLLGGGVGAGVYFSGMLGGEAKAEAHVDPNQPQLVPRGGEDGHGEAKEGEYESSYFPLEKEFTSNLKDSTHFVQLGIAVATNYDERVIQNVEKHQLPIRSAVLLALADTDEEQVFTQEGKAEMQRRLTKAINDTLVEKTGFGGVGNVYFTNFIVQ